MGTFEVLKKILKQHLQLGEEVDEFDLSTGMLGDIPELDSVNIVGLIGAIEENWGIEVDDEDITAEVFETIGSLVNFIDSKLEEI